MNFLKYSVLIFLLLITVAQDQSDETIFPEWPEGYSSKFKSYSGFLDVDITRFFIKLYYQIFTLRIPRKLK